MVSLIFSARNRYQLDWCSFPQVLPLSGRFIVYQYRTFPCRSVHGSVSDSLPNDSLHDYLDLGRKHRFREFCFDPGEEYNKVWLPFLTAHLVSNQFYSMDL